MQNFVLAYISQTSVSDSSATRWVSNLQSQIQVLNQV